MTKKIWSSVSETAENLGMSASILWRLKRDKHLIAGIHWVYLSGKRTANVGWSIPEIKTWQCEQTKLIEKKYTEETKKLETYSTMGA